MNGTKSNSQVTPGSPANKRKPVPTPRSTLRKPTPEEQARKKEIINSQNSSPEAVKNGENGEDILAALEKIPGVGSLRSLNSVGSSQPSFDAKFKREESSHSISSGLSLGVISNERKKSLGERSRTSPRILLLNGKTEEKIYKAGGSDVTDATSLSSPTSSGGGKIPRGTEKRRSLKSVKIDESDNDKTIQDRPLPEIPPAQVSEEDEIEVLSKDEIYTSLLTPTEEDHYQELKPTQNPIVVAQTEIKRKTADMNSLASSNKTTQNYLTLTGTIKRGKLPEKSLDIQLSVTPDHLTRLEKRVHDKYHDRCFCGLRRGPHVLLISLLSIPFMLIYTFFQAFFLGSMTWYNIFLYYNEDRTCCHKLLSPFVLLFYPFWIVPVTIGLCLHGGFRCISWYWDSWIQEVTNPDSGFMAWICAKMNLPDCSPYQVVLLSAEESPPQSV